MKKRKLHKLLMKAQEEIAVQISVINMHNERLIAQEARMNALWNSVSEISRRIAKIIDTIEPGEPQSSEEG